MRLNAFKLARLRAGLRQVDVAEKLGVSESLVAKWETGRVRINKERKAQLEQLFGAKLK